ncbi:MAG: universal stress protein [Actinomycetota bacterium]|nr:universal stress protein [Actinomycetota bacterium]
MYKHIVVGTGGSDRANAAVQEAAVLARLAGGQLHLVQGVGSPVVFADTYSGRVASHIQEGVEVAGRTLENMVAQIRETGIEVAVHVKTSAGHAALCEVAEEVDADLIVVGNRGMTGASRFLGSVPNSVSHQAPCSVLIVRTS